MLATKNQQRWTRRVQKRLKALIPLLKVGRRKERFALLKKRHVMSCLFEISKNVLCGHIPLPNNQMIKWRKHRTNIRLLANKKQSHKKKFTILKQKGDAILPGLLLPIASALIKPILSSVL